MSHKALLAVAASVEASGGVEPAELVLLTRSGVVIGTPVDLENRVWIEGKELALPLEGAVLEASKLRGVESSDLLPDDNHVFLKDATVVMPPDCRITMPSILIFTSEIVGISLAVEGWSMGNT